MRVSAGWRSAGFGPGWGLGFLETMFALLPLRLAYLLVVGLAPIYFMHHNRPRHSVVRAMRRMGLGLPWWRALGAYVQYTLTLVDRHYATAGRLHPRLDRRGGGEVYERLDRKLADGRPLVFLGHHCGALEMAVSALETQGRAVRAVAVQDPPSSRLLEIVGDSARSVGGARRAIVADGTMAAGLKMITALRSGDVLAFKADRALPGAAATHTISFFGDRVDLPRGPEEIARLARADVEVLSVFRTGAGRYRVLADPLPIRATSQEMVQDFGRIFAQHLREQPNQWFNFFPWWRADRRELASLPSTVPPALRASAAALPGSLAGLLVAAGVLLLGAAPVRGALIESLLWGVGGTLALWVIVGFLGGGLDRSARLDQLARTGTQAGWAWTMTPLLAGVGFEGWLSLAHLVVAAVLGLLAAAWVTLWGLRRLAEEPRRDDEVPRPPAAPASPGRARSTAGTAPPDLPQDAAPAL